MADHIKRFDEGFKASVIDAPEEDGVEVISATETSGTLRFVAIQPKALIEGHIHGCAAIYDASIVSLRHELREESGHDYHFFNVEWAERAN